MDFKPNAILDSMDRAQALACIYPDSHNANGGRFVFDKTVYTCPENIGLPRIACIASQSMCANCLRAAINAYYDAKDAASKPRWGVPVFVRLSKDEMYYIDGRGDAFEHEIARTNARRKITSTIDANGGSGVYALAYDAIKGEFYVEKLDNTVLYAGEIRCVSRELAQHIIETLRDELLLVVGVKS